MSRCIICNKDTEASQITQGVCGSCIARIVKNVLGESNSQDIVSQSGEVNMYRSINTNVNVNGSGINFNSPNSLASGRNMKSQATSAGDRLESGAVKQGEGVVVQKRADSKSQGAINVCPSCGERLNLPKTPRFCPNCGDRISLQ